MNAILHISVLEVYFLLSKIYGDIYKGVPTNEANISFLKLSTHFANPKSASLNVYLICKTILLYQ